MNPSKALAEAIRLDHEITVIMVSLITTRSTLDRLAFEYELRVHQNEKHHMSRDTAELLSEIEEAQKNFDDLEADLIKLQNRQRYLAEKLEKGAA